jgi:hypothetical protein
MPPPGPRDVAPVEGETPIVSVGTTVANMNTSRVAAFPGVAKVRTWGGARNRADRMTVELTLAQVAATIEAAQIAAAAGIPLNRHITVHWERAGVPDNRAAAATGAFIKLASQFLQKRGEPFAYVWIRENDDGDGCKGSHVHILAHVRPDAAAAFVRMQRRWLERVTGNPYRAGVIRTRRIGGWLRAAETAPELYRENLGAILAYIVKGASSEAATALGLERHGEGGRVIGKRASRSQNLNLPCLCRSALL